MSGAYTLPTLCGKREWYQVYPIEDVKCSRERGHRGPCLGVREHLHFYFKEESPKYTRKLVATTLQVVSKQCLSCHVPLTTPWLRGLGSGSPLSCPFCLPYQYSGPMVQAFKGRMGEDIFPELEEGSK